MLYCLENLAPELAHKYSLENKLTKVHYRAIRKKLGKPRRFSEAFLNEERLVLNKKREKIRVLQANKSQSEMEMEIDTEDLPKNAKITPALTIGTRVDCVIFENPKFPNLLNNSSDQSIFSSHDGSTDLLLRGGGFFRISYLHKT